jgi:hypothetical protein
MALPRGALHKALIPGFKKVIFDQWKQLPLEGKNLVNTETSKRAYEETWQMAGFQSLRRKVEGGQVSFEDPRQGGTKRFLFDTYALGFRITWEMQMDDLYSLVGNRLMKYLSRSARHNEEVILHAPFNNGFNTAFSGFTAGESLFGDHVLIKGGTLRNRPATDADIDLLTLQAAMEHFHSLTLEDGVIKMRLIPQILVHSVGDQWIVDQLLKSKQLPGTNYNDYNSMANQGLQPHLSHYLDDPDAWFILASQHEVKYFNRYPATLWTYDDPRTKDIEAMIIARRGSDWDEWRGTYGSSGG